MYIIFLYLYNKILSGAVNPCHKEWASKIQNIGEKSSTSNTVTRTAKILNQPMRYAWDTSRLTWYHHDIVITKVKKPIVAKYHNYRWK